MNKELRAFDDTQTGDNGDGRHKLPNKGVARVEMHYRLRRAKHWKEIMEWDKSWGEASVPQPLSAPPQLEASDNCYALADKSQEGISLKARGDKSG